MRALGIFSGFTKRPMAQNTSLYKSKAKFLCVSVDQALISNENNVKNLKLSDFLCSAVPITLINIKTDFPF